MQNVWTLLAADALIFSVSFELHSFTVYAMAMCMYWHSPLHVIRSLGTVGKGVTCKVLQERFRADSSPSSVRRVLVFLRQQPGPLHTSLVNLSTLIDTILPSMMHVIHSLCIFWTEKVCDWGAVSVWVLLRTSSRPWSWDCPVHAVS